MDENTDEGLIRLIQLGQFSLFEQIVFRYESKITRYARKFLSNNQDIEDTVQNIFLKAYKYIQTFDTNQKFSTWLYAISHNELVNALKKRKKIPIISIDTDTFFPTLPDKENVLERIIKKDDFERMEKCFDLIPVKYKEIIILYYLEEFDYKEIADILKIPISTVGVRLKRAKDKIQNICNQKHDNK